MSRPGGVTAIAVVEILFSAVAVLIGVLMLFGATMSADQPPGFGPVLVVMCVVILALAGLGMWTGIALLRLRPWARISTLVFAGFMGVGSALAAMTMALIPPPPMPDAQQQIAFATMRPFLVGIYLIPVAIGVWWLVYFNRATTKAAFAEGYVPGEPPARPLSISIIGWISVVGGAFGIPLAFTGFPAFLAGFVFTGWSAKAAYFILGAIGVTLGWSVLKLKEIGRKLMIAYYGLTIVHSAYIALVPGAREKLVDVQRSIAFPTPRPTSLDATDPAMAIAMMVFGVTVGGVAIWFLVKERARFS